MRGSSSRPRAFNVGLEVPATVRISRGSLLSPLTPWRLRATFPVEKLAYDVLRAGRLRYGDYHTPIRSDSYTSRTRRIPWPLHRQRGLCVHFLDRRYFHRANNSSNVVFLSAGVFMVGNNPAARNSGKDRLRKHCLHSHEHCSCTLTRGAL